MTLHIFIFGIKSIVLIESVNLNTLLKSTIFYIISVNILFLLCIVDIDKYGAFFNNITNKVF